MIPPLVLAHRFRPVQLVQHERRSGFRAPFAAVEATPDPVAQHTNVALTSQRKILSAVYDASRRRVTLRIDLHGEGNNFISRRHGRVRYRPQAIALTLTGRWLTAWSRNAPGSPWTARCKVDATEFVEVRDPDFLAGLEVLEPRGAASWRSGTFGQIGLRDLHLITRADGSAYVRDGRHWLTATQAGPGFADAAQTGVWSWLPGTDNLRHESLLWWQRDGLVLGDHAVHLVRDDDRWHVLASTWGDFDRTRVAITHTTTDADLLVGEHVLEARELDLPEPPGPHVGAWDPHLARVDGEWHLAWVAARKFFDFRPALARAAAPTGPWELVGTAEDRTATEGCVIVETDEGWRLLASDGIDNPAGKRERYPAYDLEMREVGALDAAYGSNIPWPSVVKDGDAWSMITFDGTPYGGRLPGYGTHGDVVVLRQSGAGAASRPQHETVSPRQSSSVLVSRSFEQCPNLRLAKTPVAAERPDGADLAGLGPARDGLGVNAEERGHLRRRQQRIIVDRSRSHGVHTFPSWFTSSGTRVPPAVAPATRRGPTPATHIQTATWVAEVAICDPAG